MHLAESEHWLSPVDLILLLPLAVKLSINAGVPVPFQPCLTDEVMAPGHELFLFVLHAFLFPSFWLGLIERALSSSLTRKRAPTSWTAFFICCAAINMFFFTILCLVISQFYSSPARTFYGVPNWFWHTSKLWPLLHPFINLFSMPRHLCVFSSVAVLAICGLGDMSHSTSVNTDLL